MKLGWNLASRASVAAIVALAQVALAQTPAGTPVKLKVAAAQLQALGIQTIALQAPAEGARRSYPAQVAARAGAEQVVSSPVAGLVTRLQIEPLETVRAGSPLVRIASAELGQLQLQLLQASSRLALARQTAKREQDLLAEGIVAQRRAQEAQAALHEAQAALTQAKAALRLAGMGDADIDRVAASGKPEDGVTLSAPRAGVITQVLVKPGQRVEAAAALLHIARSDALALEIQLPATELGQWPVGTAVEIAGGGGKARITGVSPQVSPNTQTTVLRAAIEGRAANVRPGQMVAVELVGLRDGGFDVPLAAVAHDGDQAAVFVRTDDGFEARPVKVVSSSGQRARVSGNLKAGEAIAVSGIVALKGAWQDAAAKGAK